MEGTTFEFSSTGDHEHEDSNNEELFWNHDLPVDDYKNPCETSFDEWKSTMTEVTEDVLKKVVKKPKEDAKKIDLLSQRISYHRNMYVENEDYPFDSTYLNGKSDEICLPLDSNGVFLIGFLEALESMKEGEKSLFLIGYKKMFKEIGSQPRVSCCRVIS